MRSRFESLKACPCFSRLPDEDLARLAAASERRHVLQGQTLFKEGESGDEMFVIELGTIRLSARGDDGDEQIAVLGSGSWFGELAVVAETHRRLTTATVLESSYVVCLNRLKLEEAARLDASFAARLWQAHARALVRRLDASQHTVAHLRDVSRRAARAGVLHGPQPTGSSVPPVNPSR